MKTTNIKLRLKRNWNRIHVFECLEGRLIFANWVFQFQNEFILIMHILTIQCTLYIKFTFSEIFMRWTFCSSSNAISICFCFFLLLSVNDCNSFRSVFIDLDKVVFFFFWSPIANAWCQSEQSIWPSITAHWTSIYHRGGLISPCVCVCSHCSDSLNTYFVTYNSWHTP